MNRVEKILVRVRDTLADPYAERWSEDRLIRLIDEAQLDICMRAKILRAVYEFDVIDGQAEYVLPENVMLIDRVLLNGNVINLVSHNELDRQIHNWTKDRGQVTHCVFDKQRRGHLRLYPIPEMATKSKFDFKTSYNDKTSGGIYNAFGVVAGGVDMDTPFGVVAEMAGVYQADTDNTPSIVVMPYLMFHPFGCVSRIMYDTPQEEVPDFCGMAVDIEGYKSEACIGNIVSLEDNDNTYITCEPFGIIAGLNIMSAKIELNYIRKPKTITTKTDELDIDSVFDKAIKYYVTAKALQDDMDTQNVAVGAREFSYYERELALALKDDIKDFTRNNRQYGTRYRTGFDI